jgi:hypothetical protein
MKNYGRMKKFCPKKDKKLKNFILKIDWLEKLAKFRH